MPSSVQSVVFMRDRGWTVNKAKSWLREHDYRTNFHGKRVDIKPNQLRFRQKPVMYSRYTTQKLDNGVLLIIGHL